MIVLIVNRSKLVQRFKVQKFKVRFGKGKLARFDNSQNVKIQIRPSLAMIPLRMFASRVSPRKTPLRETFGANI